MIQIEGVSHAIGGTPIASKARKVFPKSARHDPVA